MRTFLVFARKTDRSELIVESIVESNNGNLNVRDSERKKVIPRYYQCVFVVVRLELIETYLPWYLPFLVLIRVYIDFRFDRIHFRTRLVREERLVRANRLKGTYL